MTGKPAAGYSGKSLADKLGIRAGMRIAALESSLRDDAVLWISWPKQSSGHATDLTEDALREVILPLGLVDVKVCAVDDTWSALKFVRRLQHRR